VIASREVAQVVRRERVCWLFARPYYDGVSGRRDAAPQCTLALAEKRGPEPQLGWPPWTGRTRSPLRRTLPTVRCDPLLPTDRRRERELARGERLAVGGMRATSATSTSTSTYRWRCELLVPPLNVAQTGVDEDEDNDM